jgi:hypothetical protein
MEKRIDFEKEVHNFYSLLSNLNAASAQTLQRALGIINGSVKPGKSGITRESEAELVIRELTVNIDDLISAFDNLLFAIGKEPRYKLLQS